MLIKESEIEKLKKDMSNARIGKANKFVTDKDVSIDSIHFSWDYDYTRVDAYVEDRIKRVRIDITFSLKDKTIKWYNCNYDYMHNCCEHVLAVAIVLATNTEIEKNIWAIIQKHVEENEKREFNNLLNSFEQLDETPHTFIEKHENQSIDIIPVLNKKNNEYELSFKIGKKKMYKIKSIMEFSKTFKNNQTINFGELLQYVNEEQAYTTNAMSFVKWLVKYGETIQYATDMAHKKINYHLKIPDNKIILDESNIEDFMECFKNSNHHMELEKAMRVIDVKEEKPNIQFNVIKNGTKYNLQFNGRIPELIKGIRKSYIIKQNEIIEFETQRFANLLNLLHIYLKSGVEKYTFDEKGLNTFVSNILMKIPEGIDISKLPEADKQKHIPKTLSVILKLDINELGMIENNVTFCYGDFEFNPFQPNSLSIPRNMAQEKATIAKMVEDGFVVLPKHCNMVLMDDEKTYEFLDEKIEEYMAKFEVLISEEFKKKQVIQPRIGTIGVKIQNDLLSIDLSSINYNPEELEHIIENYQLKKKYYKLKDGRFLKLEQNENMDFLDKLVDGMDIDFKKMKNGQVMLPINRSLYLNQLLEKNEDIQVNENQEYKKLIEDTTNVRNDEEIQIPKQLDNILRDYQKTGYKWLKVLERYKMGGILADDMGLRKNPPSNRLIPKTRKRANFYCSMSKLFIFELEK